MGQFYFQYAASGNTVSCSHGYRLTDHRKPAEGNDEGNEHSFQPDIYIADSYHI